MNFNLNVDFHFSIVSCDCLSITSCLAVIYMLIFFINFNMISGSLRDLRRE